MKSMESKLVKGLYFAGEIVDVDGITGGFNFQNAWKKPDLATPGTFKLVPYDKLKDLVLNDYKKMREMIFGDAPSSEFILDNLSELENDINKLSK